MEGELDLGEGLIEAVKRLALRHYGDDTEASMRRVVEDAVEIRLSFLQRLGQAATEMEEPIANWKVSEPTKGDQEESNVTDWLFRRRGPA